MMGWRFGGKTGLSRCSLISRRLMVQQRPLMWEIVHELKLMKDLLVSIFYRKKRIFFKLKYLKWYIFCHLSLSKQLTLNFTIFKCAIPAAFFAFLRLKLKSIFHSSYFFIQTKKRWRNRRNMTSFVASASCLWLAAVENETLQLQQVRIGCLSSDSIK